MGGIPIYFGEIAINEQYIDDKILQQSLISQKKNNKPLGEILMEKGLLQEKHVSRILKIQKNYKIKLEREYFSHMALKNGYLSNKETRQLKTAHTNELRSGNIKSFLKFAIENNFLDKSQVETLIHTPELVQFKNLKKKGKTSIAGYELVGVIKKLKQTLIYKAIQIDLDRLVGIKTLQKEFETREYIKNLFQEAKATARFNHPNLVRVYDTGFENGRYYYAMEVVEGENLSDRLQKEKRLQLKDAIKLMKQIVNAVGHIHSYDYIHTKINPRNIVIRDDGVAKLLDLSNTCRIGKNSKKIIYSKQPQYMPPEQFKANAELGCRSDIYSLGCSFYHILTGKSPFSGNNIEEIRNNIIETDPPRIEEIDHTIPKDLRKLIHRMIRKDPQKRHPEIKHVAKGLEKCMDLIM